MTVTTTGSTASITVISNSTLAAVPIVVKEDVYKGSTLVRTTYRNISFTTNFAPTVYGASDQPTNGTLDVFRTPMFVFGSTTTGGSTAGPMKGVNNGRFRVYQSTNASDPLPTVTLPLYISTAAGTPVTQERIAWAWYMSGTGFPVSWTFTAPGGSLTGGSYSGGNPNSGNGSGTGGYTWSNGLHMIEFTFTNIPLGGYLDFYKTASLLPLNLNKLTVIAKSAYQSDTENRLIESFNTDGTISLLSNTSTYTFQISTSYRQSELYLIFEGTIQVYNVVTTTWDSKTGTDGSAFSSELKLTNYYTTVNGVNYVRLQGPGNVNGFSMLTYPVSSGVITSQTSKATTGIAGSIDYRTPSVLSTAGAIGNVDSTGNLVMHRNDNGADPEIIIPFWYNPGAPYSQTPYMGIHWGHPQPSTNYFIWTSLNGSGEILSGENVQWPQWVIDTDNPSYFGGTKLPGLNYFKIRLDRGPDSTTGPSIIDDVYTQLPTGWKYKNVTARNAYSFNSKGYTIDQVCSRAAAEAFFDHTMDSGGTLCVMFQIDMITAVDSKLFITWRGPLRLLTDNVTTSININGPVSVTWMGADINSTNNTQMLLDPLNYTVINQKAYVKIQHGQVDLVSLDLAVVGFQFLSS